MAEPDLSKIINVIMENPALVEEIRSMVRKSEAEDRESEPQIEGPGENSTAEEEDTQTTYPKSKASRRNDLLRAMRPYVSEQRGRAIESMISIADIIFAIREK